jgi:HSP20 family molecular chaperone IbpA
MKPGFYVVAISSVYSFTTRFYKGFRGIFRADTILIVNSIQTCLLYKGRRESEEVNEMPNLLRWFVDLAKEMDRGMSTMRGGGKPEISREPEVLIGESGVLVRMRMAGVGPEDVDLTISNKGALTVSGIIRPDSDGEKIYNLEDLNFEAFRKVVNLPVGYENAEGRATFKDGILEVSIEKSESEEEVRQLRIENS